MFYVLDENNNKVEALDKEGVFSTLEQAIANGSLANLVADASFVSKLKCCVSGVTNSVAFVTQATYNTLVAQGTVKANTYYFITDDPTFDEVEELVVSLNNAVVDLDEKVNDVATQLNDVDTRLKDVEKIESKYIVIPVSNYASITLEDKTFYIIKSNQGTDVSVTSVMFVDKTKGDSDSTLNSLNRYFKYNASTNQISYRNANGTIADSAAYVYFYKLFTI